MAKTGDYLPKAYIRGEIVDYKDATVPMSTSALQYGLGCFAGIRGYKQADGSVGIFRLNLHAQRLAHSAQMLHFDMKITADEIAGKIRALMEANAPQGSSDIYIRPFIYKSDTNLGPGLTGEFDLGIYMLELEEYLDTKKGIRAGISSWEKVSNKAIPSKSKATGGYINAALAIDEMTKEGYDAAIMCDAQGTIPEGSVMNVFTVNDNTLITPGLEEDLLAGITRRSILELAEELDIKVLEQSLTREQLYAADEAFFSGTATEIAWVSSVDKNEISKGIGPITKKLQEEFKLIVAGDHKLSNEWLDIVSL